MWQLIRAGQLIASLAHRFPLLSHGVDAPWWEPNMSACQLSQDANASAMAILVVESRHTADAHLRLSSLYMSSICFL